MLFLFSNNRINVKGAVRLSIAVAVNTGLQVLKVDFMIIDFSLIIALGIKTR